MGEAVFSTTARWRADSALRRSTILTRMTAPAIIMCFAILAAGSARAETTTERSSSILIFPKVVYDGSRDTFIQISNTSNSMVHAHCFYVDATPECIGNGDCLAGTCSGRCEQRWQEVDFSIWLTKQQPTHWTVGVGRFKNPIDPQCTPGDSQHRLLPNYDCDGAGLDPGRVPPVSRFPFQGELRCIEVDQSGAPISGNHLKGEATIISADGDSAKYNAIGLLGEPFTNNGDNILCLGGGPNDECPSGAEYEGCSERVLLDHFGEGADDLLFGPTSTVATEVTLVPCRADYETQEPTSIVIQFLAFNEFEERYSASSTVDCWRSFFLDEISNIFTVPLQTRFMLTTMRSSNLSNSGFVGVSEEYHHLGAETTRAAFNLHDQGSRAKTDFIFIPEGP